MYTEWHPRIIDLPGQIAGEGARSRQAVEISIRRDWARLSLGPRTFDGRREVEASVVLRISL